MPFLQYLVHQLFNDAYCYRRSATCAPCNMGPEINEKILINVTQQEHWNQFDLQATFRCFFIFWVQLSSSYQLLLKTHLTRKQNKYSPFPSEYFCFVCFSWTFCVVVPSDDEWKWQIAQTVIFFCSHLYFVKKWGKTDTIKPVWQCPPFWLWTGRMSVDGWQVGW